MHLKLTPYCSFVSFPAPRAYIVYSLLSANVEYAQSNIKMVVQWINSVYVFFFYLFVKMDKISLLWHSTCLPHVSPKYPTIFSSRANGTNKKERDEKNNSVWVNDPQEVPPLFQ